MSKVQEQQVIDILASEMAKELILARFKDVDEVLLQDILARDENHDHPFRRGIDASIIYQLVKMADNNGHQ